MVRCLAPMYNRGEQLIIFMSVAVIPVELVNCVIMRARCIRGTCIVKV